jgi:hypothetical protein
VIRFRRKAAVSHRPPLIFLEELWRTLQRNATCFSQQAANELQLAEPKDAYGSHQLGESEAAVKNSSLAGR